VQHWAITLTIRIEAAGGRQPGGFMVSVFNNFVKKAQNGPSTPHVIDAASFVKFRNSTIGAEELSYFSSYQTLTAYKNW
jgi:hypothetical protein